MNEQTEERLLDLLCKQAVHGLTNEELNEFRSTEGTFESSVDLASLEMTAAAIAISAVPANDTLPDHLKAGILAQADEYFAAQNNANSPAMTSVSQTGKPSMPIWGWLGWGAAAAASLLLIVNIWNSKPADIAVNTATQSPIPERLSPAQMRDRFMAAVPSSEMVKAEWGQGNVANLAVSGDVVWSDKMQEGYLRFTNLPKNDTSQYTYQLWIFDENQDPKTPIDGGIFDVNADGEIIIPITAKLHARGAKAFAITMEKPGGVMVSDRSKIVTLGSVKPNQA